MFNIMQWDYAAVAPSTKLLSWLIMFLYATNLIHWKFECVCLAVVSVEKVGNVQSTYIFVLILSQIVGKSLLKTYPHKQCRHCSLVSMQDEA